VAGILRPDWKGTRNLTRATLIATASLGAVLGLAGGLGAYTFIYARGASYLTNDPAACVNCHVMQEQFNGWAASSHRAVARCNDCHAPHAIIPKLGTKVRNGFRHSLAFTSGTFPEPIRITPHNEAITEHACRSCHDEVVQAIEGPHGSEEISCIRCHRSVGHLH
jgi:cytochrome c nitrite reductase small subunit